MQSRLILSLSIILSFPLVSNSGDVLQDTEAYKERARTNWTNFVNKLNNDEHVSIVFLGDSITEQNFHTHDKPNYFVHMREYFLDKNNKATVINAGKSGDTTVKAFDRMTTSVLAHEPDLTFVMLGINDSSSWFNVSLDQYKTFLRRIVTTLLDNNSAIIIMTQNEMLENPYDGKVTFTNYPAYEDAALEIARELGVIAIDNYSQWKFLKQTQPETFKSYMNDWIHPNENGHLFYSNIIRAELDRVFAKIEGDKK